jgi:hypothetical protein
MMESKAWRTAPLSTRRFVDRLMVEYMNHAGLENGNLICTYTAFADWGIRRNSIKKAQNDAIKRGLIYLERGRASPGDDKKPNVTRERW